MNELVLVMVEVTTYPPDIPKNKPKIVQANYAVTILTECWAAAVYEADLGGEFDFGTSSYFHVH